MLHPVTIFLAVGTARLALLLNSAARAVSVVGRHVDLSS